MSKTAAFIGLAFLAIVFAYLGFRSQTDFLSNFLSQLFWLSIGTLATTFVLESILQRGVQRRQQSHDAFAFRTFSTNMLLALEEILKVERTDDKLIEAALSGNNQFKGAAAAASSLLEHSANVEHSAYEKYYLDLATGLRAFSRDYIRLFSEDQKDMVKQYQQLNSLASLWTHMDEFPERARLSRASLKPGDPDKQSRDRAFNDQTSSARNMAIETGRLLARLAAKLATGKGFYD